MKKAVNPSASNRKGKFSAGFTMLELIFVIVVMGIIGKIGAEVLRMMYDNYISTAVNNRMQADTELTLQQIANRLQYRLRDSVIAANTARFDGLSSAPDDVNYTRIEWIGYDIDGWLGRWNGTANVPAWSGFIDVDALDTANADSDTLHSPGTETNASNIIIQAVSPGAGGTGFDNSAIFFTGANTNVQNDYGWSIGGTLPIPDQNGTAAHRIKADAANADRLDAAVDDFNSTDIYEQYKLSWTAYALSVEDSNLWLYYDYRPWEGDTFDDDGIRVLLLENVSTVKAQAIGDTIKFQICVDNNSTDSYSLCKEKVIF